MRGYLLALGVLLPFLSIAQSPVSWNYSAKKLTDKSYEIHITATVSSPWHIYSQYTPEGGPLPTMITFNKNPLVSFEGKAKETGNLVKKYEEVFEVDVKYFDGKVDFVQVVKLKSNVKTNVNGTVEFMVCNDTQCLPPSTIPFSISLQ